MAAAVLPVSFVLDVGESDVDDIYDMLVIQRIEYVFSVTAALYQPFVFEQAKLVGDRRFCHVESRGNVVYAKLICGYGAENLHSGFIAHHFKKCGGFGYKFF